MPENKEIKYCQCGCGTVVKNKWAWGHHSRVNNISKRSDVKEKRRKTAFERHKVGGFGEIWNKGKTKEEDTRLIKCGRPVEVLSEEERKFRSDQMKKSWAEEKIVPLRGPDHPQWQGGTSTITQRVRGATRHYETWKRPILVRDSFRCTRCGSGHDLVVHHDVRMFAEIMKERLLELYPDARVRRLTWDEETRVVDDIIDHHVSQDVSGITLCEPCHDLVHERSGIRDLD